MPTTGTAISKAYSVAGQLPRTIHPWPLVPATILGLLGIAFATRNLVVIDWIQAGVAILLVVAGAAMVLRRTDR